MKLLIKDTGKVRVIADSAIGRNRQPWFLPDAGTDWRWRRAVAYRVSKLGKSVAPTYISRYIDAVTLLWVAEADGFDGLDYMDGAVVCGNWIDIDENNSLPEKALAEFTKSATVKNGDILAFMLPDAPIPITINHHISINFNNQEVLSFNIK